jgi:8-oxo-dGTP diphosphatase
VTDIREYLESFDYVSGSGKKSRQFNFAVDVAAPEPVKLTEHDTYAWSPVTDGMPVTDAVRPVLLKHWEASGLAG